jgi:hypothetical protein
MRAGAAFALESGGVESQQLRGLAALAAASLLAAAAAAAANTGNCAGGVQLISCGCESCSRSPSALFWLEANKERCTGGVQSGEEAGEAHEDPEAAGKGSNCALLRSVKGMRDDLAAALAACLLKKVVICCEGGAAAELPPPTT